MIYLFFAGSLIGFVAYTYALRHLPMSIVSLYPYVNPVVAVLLGTWLLHEPLTLADCGGHRHHPRGLRRRFTEAQASAADAARRPACRPDG